MKDEKKPTYTLWNGVNLFGTFPHTREGMEAAMEQAQGIAVGGWANLKLYSSRDDLVWSNRMAEDIMDCE